MTNAYRIQGPAAVVREWFCGCGNVPCTGLDCGVYLPGRAPRPSRSPTYHGIPLDDLARGESYHPGDDA